MKYLIPLLVWLLAAPSIASPHSELLDRYTPSCQPHAANIIVTSNHAFSLLREGKVYLADMQMDRAKEAVLNTMLSEECSLSDLQVTLRVGDDVQKLQTAVICAVRIQEIDEYLTAIDEASGQSLKEDIVRNSESVVWTLKEIKESNICSHLPPKVHATFDLMRESLTQTLTQLNPTK